MKKHFVLSAILLTSATIFTSCEKEADTANTVTYQASPVNLTASVGASLSGSGLVVEASSKSSITWTEGVLNIEEIDFEAKKDGAAIEYSAGNLVNVDITRAASALGSVHIPDGTYDEVELELHLKKSATADIPVRLKGNYTDLSGTATPVELQINEDIDISVEAENLVVTADDHVARINMHLNKLLAGISISDLTMATKTNGTIVISSTSNTALYAKIMASLETFAECEFED